MNRIIQSILLSALVVSASVQANPLRRQFKYTPAVYLVWTCAMGVIGFGIGWGIGKLFSRTPAKTMTQIMDEYQSTSDQPKQNGLTVESYRTPSFDDDPISDHAAQFKAEKRIATLKHEIDTTISRLHKEVNLTDIMRSPEYIIQECCTDEGLQQMILAHAHESIQKFDAIHTLLKEKQDLNTIKDASCETVRDTKQQQKIIRQSPLSDEQNAAINQLCEAIAQKTEELQAIESAIESLDQYKNWREYCALIKPHHDALKFIAARNQEIRAIETAEKNLAIKNLDTKITEAYRIISDCGQQSCRLNDQLRLAKTAFHKSIDNLRTTLYAEYNITASS